MEHGLRTESVVDEAGLYRAKLNREFKNKPNFINSVLSALLPPPAYPAGAVGEIVRQQLLADRLRSSAAVHKLISSHFDRLTEPAAVTRRLLANLFLGTDQHRERSVRDDYLRRDQLVGAAFEAGVEGIGATIRAPFNTKTFAVTMIAVIDGLLLRHRVDPAAVPPKVFANALLALISATVDVGQEHRDLDDQLAELDAAARSRLLVPRQRDLRTATIDAARAEFGRRGYYYAQIDSIGASVGVPPAEFRKLFETKAHIVVEALGPAMQAMTAGVADDCTLGLDEITVLRNHFHRFAQMAAEPDNGPFIDALLAVLVHDTYSDPAGLVAIKERLNMPAIILPVIASGQQRGLLRSQATALDLAASATNTMLLRCFTRRNVAAEENAEFMTDQLLYGMLSRPDR
ncbi:TetR family transcriptional regulator [Skermania piniformis]|nr:TetR family transcriptional regulator [Skermania piniformis]